MSYRNKRHVAQEMRATQTRGPILVVDGYRVRIRASRAKKCLDSWNWYNERRNQRAVQRCWKWQRKVRKQYHRE